MAALTERSRSGRGQEVDVAIYEAVAALMESTMADFEVGGALRVRHGGVLPGVAPANAYPTVDGASVIVAANVDAVFRRLCAAMGRPEMASDRRFATHQDRGAHMDELDAEIAAWTSTLATATLLDVLADHAVPAGEIFTAAEMLTDEQYAAREMVLRRTNRDGVSIPMPGVVPKFSRTPGEVVASGPALGEHTVEVLRRVAKLTEADVEALVAAGVIECSPS
jgi:formyl-CoA transferase/succinyl-CoA--D-citramalate CoA-transferase